MESWANKIVVGLYMGGSLSGVPVQWLDETPFMTFLADPFGYWWDNRLFVFYEAFDYRNRHGVINVVEFDKRFCPMLPEASRSSWGLSLYKAVQFPDQWQKVEHFTFPEVGVDASPLFYQGK